MYPEASAARVPRFATKPLPSSVHVARTGAMKSSTVRLFHRSWYSTAGSTSLPTRKIASPTVKGRKRQLVSSTTTRGLCFLSASASRERV